MKRPSLTLLLLLLCWVAQAQTFPTPVVPNNIYFADMHLEIQESGRTEIQKMVDALLKHPGYFQKKVELADAYFPLIEKTFLQEGLPTDFKYLALQESGLVSDAVSTSNAVGFWQFKEGSATELGVRVNAMVDERKHIIESSRGAAKYLIRSNAYYKNWFNSLLSYYQGLNGTKALTKTSDIGAKKMKVDDKTNKYLLTFLAHKVAYENFVGKNPKPTLSLQTMKANPGQSLMDIAMITQVEASEIERYNKWLLASTVPSDKEYYVVIPSLASGTRPVYAQQSPPKLTGHESKDQLKAIAATRKAQVVKVNGLSAILAQVGDTKDMLALQAGISTKKLLKYNDLRSFDEIVAGRSYYTEAKRTKADAEYHVARTGETTHDVSQKYGVKLSSLLRMNRMKRNEALIAGRVLWLQKTRPHKTPVEYKPIQDEVAPQPTEVYAQQPVQTPAPARTAPAPITAPVASQNTSYTAAPATSATAAQPKPNAISYEVEDTAALPAAPRSVELLEEEEAEAVIAQANQALLYPGKSAATANRTPAAATAPSAAKVHLVKQGETLYSISKQYNLSMADLQAWNSLNGTALAIGQALSLNGPAAAPAPSPLTNTTSASVTTAASAATHTVLTGETLYSISRKYGVTVQELQHWNHLSEGTGISVGQVLTVKAPAVSALPQASTVAMTNAGPGADASGDVITHRVLTGESLYQISRQYGVTVTEIMEWNNKTEFSVSVGENLTIRAKK